MLSFIRKTAARAWDSTSQDVLEVDYLGTQEDPVLSVDVEELRDYLPHIPWHRISQACTSAVAPVCTAVRDTVHNDIDGLAHLLLDLQVDADTDSASEASLSRLSASSSTSNALQYISGGAYDSPASDYESLSRTSGGDVPTIVITPCPSLPRDRTGWVPFQDASFGNRLVVPTHPVVNGVFPPLLAKVSPLVERWKFADGHWWALLPSPEEQMQRGMFSRPLHCRRRKTYTDNRAKFLTPRSRPPSPARRACNAT